MQPLRLTPIGGMKEVGANCFLYEAYNGTSILIDCGVHPEYDFDPHEIWERFLFLKSKNVKAIVITHVHQDHAGAVIIVANLLNIPVYTSKFGYYFLKAWQKSAVQDDFEETVLPEIKIFEHGSRISLGCFELNAYELSHSIPEAFCFLIKVGGKTVLHCGDFKLTGYTEESYEKNIAVIKELAKQEIDLLVNDIINIKNRGKTPPEKPVVENIARMIAENPGKNHFIFMFSTNIRRMANLWRVLHQQGIGVVFRGSSMHRTARILSEATGYDLKRIFSLPLAQTTVFLCTGSQGEPYSFMDRLANENPLPAVSPGDHIYISSTLIPQEDRKAFLQNRARLRRFLQTLHVKGAKIFLQHGQAALLDVREFADETLLHVSGHETRDGIKEFWSILRPVMCLPYHAPEEHIELAKGLAKEVEKDAGHRIFILDPDNNETITI